MDNHNKDGGFSYTYSAKEQEELKKIRQKYIPKEIDKMEKLRMLDKSVTQKGTIISLIAGIIGALIMGLGMSCCMVWGGDWFIPGTIIGIVGMIQAGLAYPIYTHVVKKEREKIAPEIMRLTDELMK